MKDKKRKQLERKQRKLGADAQNQPNSNPILALAPTVSRLFGIDPPEIAEVPALDTVTNEALRLLHGESIDRCLIFAPDAIGRHLRAACAEEFTRVCRICPLEIPVRSVVQPSGFLHPESPTGRP